MEHSQLSLKFCPFCAIIAACSVHFVLYAASNEQYRKAYAFFFRQVLCWGGRKGVSE